jgi:hypothetical protein
VNRVHRARPAKLTPGELEKLLAADPDVVALALSGTSLRMAAEALLAAHAEQELLAEVDKAALESVRRAGGPDALVVPVPLTREDVHDIDRLIALGRMITAPVA